MSQDSQNPENPNSGQPQRPNYPPNYRPTKSGSSKWWIPLVIIGSVLFIFIVAIIGFFSFISSEFSFKTEEKVTLKENSVLHIDYASGVPEYSRQNAFEIFGASGDDASLLNTLTAIERAKDDKNIVGIYMNIGGRLGASKAKELQDKLASFKESGKFIYAFMEAGDEQTYYNILPADSIFMPQEGIMEFNGFGTSRMFMKGLYNKLGIEFHTEQFEDFKSAGESFSRNSFSDSARHQLEILLNQYHNEFVDAVSKYRNLDKDKINNLLNQGLYTAPEFINHGLIDAYMTESQVKEFLKEMTTKDVKKEKDKKLNLFSVSRYLKGSSRDKSLEVEDKTIAIINGVGPIMSGEEGSGSPFGGDDYEIRSATFVEYLKDAREDEDIDAILIRIDSPGGSVIASDEIWHEIQETRKVKPVIASMSDVAASGGYYMAIACDEIIAHPRTITGSIGVILSIPNFEGTLDMLDITVDTISTTNSAQFLNGLYKYQDKDLKRLRTLAEDIYFRFLDKVAKSRGMTREQVRTLAKGRVWSGVDAKDNGLVDHLGGLEYAINYIKKEKLGVEEDKLVYVTTYPKKEDPFKAFLKAFGIDTEMKSDYKEKIRKEFGADMESLVLNWDRLSPEMKSQIKYSLQLMEIAKNEKINMALPYKLEVR